MHTRDFKNKIRTFKTIAAGALAAVCLACLFAFIAILNAGAAFNTASAQTQSDFYWSDKNSPVFYGATSITLSKNAVSAFDINDPRFRTFARDFEDGDLKVTCTPPAVNTAAAGSYNIEYTCTDSHNNTSRLTVPLEITDDESGVITVRRTVYCIPSDWNMTAAGFSRCNTGDRQILGIYMPENASFEIRLVTEGMPEMTIAMLNNDAYTETSQRITSHEFTQISNNCTSTEGGRTPGKYACVPLLTSPKLARGVNIFTTYEVETRYTASGVHALNYYHSGDGALYEGGEEGFRQKWTQSGDKYGIVENNVLTLVVPAADMYGFNGIDGNGKKVEGFVFGGYEEHLAYYERVVERMDKIIGLSFTPQRATDQNLRAKYLVKANAHGAGAAYYSGNHVGINSPSLFAFFQMNWGGLHEIAHGYQGHLGSGSMGLGETSNNILGHYIQTDKTLYTFAGDWLGKLSEIEEGQNLKRADKTYNDLGGDPQCKLYALINLFDYFEGENTYAKLFSYYRAKAAAGEMSSKTPQQDVYALFFAEEYKTDIIPYWSQWGIVTSEDVQERVWGLCEKTVSILFDSAGEEGTDKILANAAGGSGSSTGAGGGAAGGGTGATAPLKYGLITDEQLAEANIKGSLKVGFEIDDKSVLSKGAVLLQQGGVTKYSAEIVDGVADFADIAAGTYMVRTPADFGYDYSSGLATVENGENTYTVTYTKREEANYHPTQLLIKGIHGTVGFAAELCNGNTRANLTFGAADLGNQGAAWKARPNDEFITVTIKNGGGSPLYMWKVTGGGFFCYLENRPGYVGLEFGYTISVKTQRPDLVRVISMVDGSEIPDYNFKGSGEATLSYRVTADGLVPDYTEEFSVKDALYSHISEELIESLESQAEFFADNPQTLGTKYLEKSKKAKFVEDYGRLSEGDKAQFKELYESLVKGGVPTVTALKDSVEARSFADVDWNACFTAFDSEDGEIKYGDKVEIVSSTDGQTKGTFEVEIVVRDYDGNQGSCKISVTVTEDTHGADIGGLAVKIIAAVAAVLAAALIIFLIIFFIRRREKPAKAENSADGKQVDGTAVTSTPAATTNKPSASARQKPTATPKPAATTAKKPATVKLTAQKPTTTAAQKPAATTAKKTAATTAQKPTATTAKKPATTKGATGKTAPARGSSGKTGSTAKKPADKKNGGKK